MAAFQRNAVYSDRSIQFRGVINRAGWALKCYDISFDGSSLMESDFDAGFDLAHHMLPQPATTIDRPGVGILIRHAGETVHYIILAWWDNQNEMITRTIVRERSSSSPWHDSGGRYSFCIWDLQVLWHERNAFVRCIMSPLGGPQFEAYLNEVLQRSIN